MVNGKQLSAKAQGAANSATPKAPNPFAIFVKENYKNHKAPGVKHGDVMKILSVKFSETKISKWIQIICDKMDLNEYGWKYTEPS